MGIYHTLLVFFFSDEPVLIFHYDFYLKASGKSPEATVLVIQTNLFTHFLCKHGFHLQHLAFRPYPSKLLLRKIGSNYRPLANETNELPTALFRNISAHTRFYACNILISTCIITNNQLVTIYTIHIFS